MEKQGLISSSESPDGQRRFSLIVTSPPYNVEIKYNSHNDTMAYDDYLLFTKNGLLDVINSLKMVAGFV